jgi:hypothetical protein
MPSLHQLLPEYACLAHDRDLAKLPNFPSGNLQRNTAALDEVEAILTARPITVRATARVPLRVDAPNFALSGQPVVIQVTPAEHSRHAIRLAVRSGQASGPRPATARRRNPTISQPTPARRAAICCSASASAFTIAAPNRTPQGRDQRPASAASTSSRSATRYAMVGLSCAVRSRSRNASAPHLLSDDWRLAAL